MSEMYLAEDARFCAIGLQLVVLDLRTGKYIAVDCEACPNLLKGIVSAGNNKYRQLIVDAAVARSAAELINSLMSRRILTKFHAEIDLRPALVPVPRRSLVSVPPVCPEGLSVRAWFRVCTSFVKVALLLRFAGFKRLVRRLEAQSGVAPPMSELQNSAKLRAVVRAFCRIRPWLYTAHEHCLFDALVLTEFLRRYRQQASFVIGVAPTPFSAHAWVQVGDCLIDDTLEVIGKYSRILVA